MSRRLLAPGNTYVKKADPLPPLFEEPNDGDMYYNSSTGRLRIAIDKVWKDVVGGGGGTTLIGGQMRYVNVSGDTMDGNLTIAPEDGYSNVTAVGATEAAFFMADTPDATGRRWVLYKDNTDALVLGCYDDNGAWLGSVLLGDRVTRLLTVAGPPTAPLGIANKQFVEDTIAATAHNEMLGRSAADAHPQSAITGLSTRLSNIESNVETRAKVTVGTVAPSTPDVGDIWVDTR